MRYPPIAQKIFLWLMATGMVANRFRKSPDLGMCVSFAIASLFCYYFYRYNHHDDKDMRLTIVTLMSPSATDLP